MGVITRAKDECRNIISLRRNHNYVCISSGAARAGFCDSLCFPRGTSLAFVVAGLVTGLVCFVADFFGFFANALVRRRRIRVACKSGAGPCPQNAGKAGERLLSAMNSDWRSASGS